MKKIISVVLAFLLSFPACLAEVTDYSGWSYEELSQERLSLLERLNKVNNALGAIIQSGQVTDEAETVGRIIDLFPDETFAMLVRDGCAKLSIEQSVTQADLDHVTRISCNSWNGVINSLQGIGFLRNLKYLELGVGAFTGDTLPDEMRNLINLEQIEITSCKEFSIFPDWIDELISLGHIDLRGTSITSIPDSIGALSHLKYLLLSHCKFLTSLPETIGNCTSLTTLWIDDTSISSLPLSLYSLNLTDLNMEGTDIR